MSRMLLAPIMILLICLLSSCVWTTKAIECPPLTIMCPAPFQPTLQKLNPNLTIADPDNFNIVLDNLNEIVRYSKEQKEAIRCYEDSLKDKSDKKEKVK